MTVNWIHTTATGDANGVGWVTASTTVSGLDADSAGGYVCEHTSGSDTETSGASAQGLFPLVAVIPFRSDDLGAQAFLVGFAVAHGDSVEAHVWTSHH